MAIVEITTTHEAVPVDARASLARQLTTLTYEAEGFKGSAVAPTICWTFFNEKPASAFATGFGEPDGPLYYIKVTALAGAVDKVVKQSLSTASPSPCSRIKTRHGLRSGHGTRLGRRPQH